MNRQDLYLRLFKPDGGIRKVAVIKPDRGYRIKTGIKTGKTKFLGKQQVFFISKPGSIDFSPANNLDVPENSVFYRWPYYLRP